MIIGVVGASGELLETITTRLSEKGVVVVTLNSDEVPPIQDVKREVRDMLLSDYRRDARQRIATQPKRSTYTPPVNRKTKPW